MSKSGLIAVAGTVLIVGAAVAANIAADASNREAASMALSAAGYDHVEIGSRHAFGGCLNGKGGTRWRYDWTAALNGAPDHGTICAGGLLQPPAIREGQ